MAQDTIKRELQPNGSYEYTDFWGNQLAVVRKDSESDMYVFEHVDTMGVTPWASAITGYSLDVMDHVVRAIEAQHRATGH
jgi:hypothetical protein